MNMDTFAQPQISPDAGVEERMRSGASDLLTEEIVPKSLRDKVEVIVNPDGALSISRQYLKDQEFKEYLKWVRSAPEVSESVKWDDVIPPGQYQIPKGILGEMVKSAEPYRKTNQLSKSRVLGHAVEIYHRMRGKIPSKELCSFLGRALARTNYHDLEQICRRLEENIRGAVGQTLRSCPDRSDVLEITPDETWLEVLNFIRAYGIPKVTFEEDRNKLRLEGMGESQGVLVRAELEDPLTGGSELEKLEVSAETLAKALRAFDMPCRAEIRAGDREMKVRPLDPARAEADSIMEWILPVEKSPQDGFKNLDMDYSVEAEGVELEFPLYAAEKIHGTEGFQATIFSEDGKLLFDYWTEDSKDGNKAVLGEAQGGEASATYHPELLEPLRGEWNLKLGEGLPLRAEKALNGEDGFWKAFVTVVIPPEAENASTPLSGSSPLFLKA